MNTGDRIKSRRKQLGMSVDTLAEKIGKNRATVYRYENGDIEGMSIALLKPIAEALDTTPTALMGWQEDNIANDMGILPITTKRLPLLGNIACGEPIWADEDLSTTIEVDSSLRADFALKCRGDSMSGDRIYDGDIVYVRKQSYVDDGTIAVCLLDNEATLKHVWHRPDGKIELRASNPTFKPIIVSDDMDFRVLGKVVMCQFYVN